MDPPLSVTEVQQGAADGSVRATITDLSGRLEMPHTTRSQFACDRR